MTSISDKKETETDMDMDMELETEEKEMEEKEKDKETEEKRKKWRIRQNGVWFNIDKKLTMESEKLHRRYGSMLVCELMRIKKVSIFKRALRFCKHRAEIRIKHRDDGQKVLRDKLNEFDSEFFKQIHNEADAIGLIQVAGELRIGSLFNLLTKHVVDTITSKTPEEIDNLFKARYKKGDDKRFEEIHRNMDTLTWPRDVFLFPLRRTDRASS